MLQLSPTSNWAAAGKTISSAVTTNHHDVRVHVVRIAHLISAFAQLKGAN